jgi:hypothetical protein
MDGRLLSVNNGIRNDLIRDLQKYKSQILCMILGGVLQVYFIISEQSISNSIVDRYSNQICMTIYISRNEWDINI